MRLLHWHGFQQRTVDMTGAAAVTGGAAVTAAVSGERVRCCRCTQRNDDKEGHHRGYDSTIDVCLMF